MMAQSPPMFWQKENQSITIFSECLECHMFGLRQLMKLFFNGDTLPFISSETNTVVISLLDPKSSPSWPMAMYQRFDFFHFFIFIFARSTSPIESCNLGTSSHTTKNHFDPRLKWQPWMLMKSYNHLFAVWCSEALCFQVCFFLLLSRVPKVSALFKNILPWSYWETRSHMPGSAWTKTIRAEVCVKNNLFPAYLTVCFPIRFLKFGLSLFRKRAEGNSIPISPQVESTGLSLDRPIYAPLYGPPMAIKQSLNCRLTSESPPSTDSLLQTWPPLYGPPTRDSAKGRVWTFLEIKVNFDWKKLPPPLKRPPYKGFWGQMAHRQSRMGGGSNLVWCHGLISPRSSWPIGEPEVPPKCYHYSVNDSPMVDRGEEH